MKINLIGTVIFLTSQLAFGNTLTLDFQAKDLAIAGTFTFKPGHPLKISSIDDSGRPYELEVTTKIKKENIVQFVYHLKSGKEIQSGSVIVEKGRTAQLTSGVEGDRPSIRFEAKWAE